MVQNNTDVLKQVEQIEISLIRGNICRQADSVMLSELQSLKQPQKQAFVCKLIQRMRLSGSCDPASGLGTAQMKASSRHAGKHFCWAAIICPNH